MIKSRPKISRQAAGLKKIRLYLGMTRLEFSNRIGISQFTIRSWEIGAKNFTEESVKRLIRALYQKMNFVCSLEWLMHGTGKSPISLYEDKNETEIIKFDSADEHLLQEIIFFKRSNPEINITTATGEEFEPLAEAGDYIGLLPIPPNSIKDYLNKIIFIAPSMEAAKLGIIKKINNILYIFTLNTNRKYKLDVNDLRNIFQIVWFRKTKE